MGVSAKRLSVSVLAAVCLLLMVGGASAQTTGALTLSAPAGDVGSTLTIAGTGYPPNMSLVLEWNSANANWIIGGVTPQVTGINVVPTQRMLGTTTTNSSGAFSTQITVPADFGMSHVIQAYATNGTAFSPKATYDLEPKFTASPLSGPAGTPITITATGLGDGLYSTSYHVYWDNNYVGYATALNSQGSTTFTIYAAGGLGTHFLAIYQGYPGPGYLNAEQIPAASATQSYYPAGCTVMVNCQIPYYVNFTVTSTGDPAPAPRVGCPRARLRGT